MDYLSDFLGQDRVKRKLNFYIEGYQKTGYIKPLLFSAARGLGKTTLARLVAKNLQKDGAEKPKPYIEINGSSVKSVGGLIDAVLVPYVFNQEVTILADEIHLCNPLVINWLLSVIPGGNETITKVYHAGIEYEFDWHKLSLFIATTNPEKLFEAFKSRFDRIEIENYTEEILKKILLKNCENINFLENSEDSIVGVSRGLPRQIVNLTKDIKQYCITKNKEEFDLWDWSLLQNTLGIRSLGLQTHEVELMKYLEARGSQSLTSIAAKLGLDPTTVRRDVELFLLKNNLIHIDGKRSITQYGREILKTIN